MRASNEVYRDEIVVKAGKSREGSGGGLRREGGHGRRSRKTFLGQGGMGRLDSGRIAGVRFGIEIVVEVVFAVEVLRSHIGELGRVRGLRLLMAFSAPRSPSSQDATIISHHPITQKADI
jgi:hypothetical protein